MKLVRGRTLEDYLDEAREQWRKQGREDGEHALAARLEVYLHVCDALSYAHERGVLHRDLKPENVMLQTVAGRRKVVRGIDSQAHPTVEQESTYDHVKILDFGVAKFLDLEDPSRRTMSGTIIGTPHYMAPETARATSEVDHRIDIYALGVLFYEMLTAALPFEGKNPVEVMVAHCSQPLVPPRTKNPHAEVTDAADALIARALAKDPADRPRTMHEFLDELQRCYGDDNFLRNVEKQSQPGGMYARRRSLTEDLKELFASGGGNEILERALARDDDDTTE